MFDTSNGEILGAPQRCFVTKIVGSFSFQGQFEAFQLLNRKYISSFRERTHICAAWS